MTSRERVWAAIHHQQPDRVPVDVGATGQTGIAASTIYKLREAMGLEQRPIRVSEIFQILGEIEPDMMQFTQNDVIGLNNPGNMFGVDERGATKPFTLNDGTPTLIGAGNEYDRAPDGTVLMYPQGNRSVPPSGHMPATGCFFDNINRAPDIDPDIDEDDLTPIEDFKNDFAVMTDELARYYETEAKRLFEETDYAIIGNLGGGSFGDSAVVPGPHVLAPKGIRKFDEWLMAHMMFPDYIEEIFTMQTDIMLKNLEMYKQAVGDKIQIIWISGTDFGTQNAAFFRRETFHDLYAPQYKRINDWVHANTPWKTFYHSCGSVVTLLDEFVDMGMDILNPVQVSANGMDAHMLKEKYGEKLVFWGGGVDTQATLPFGTPEEVYAQVQERLEIFSKDGGYVFNPIHNVVAKTPTENLMAMYQAVQDFNSK